MLKLKVIDESPLSKSIKEWPFTLSGLVKYKIIDFNKPEPDEDKMDYMVRLWQSIQKHYSKCIYQLWIVLTDNEPATRIEYVKLDVFNKLDEITIVVIFIE